MLRVSLAMMLFLGFVWMSSLAQAQDESDWPRVTSQVASSSGSKKPFNTRGSYLSLGAKMFFWQDRSFSDPSSESSGSASRLSLNHNHAVYYQLALGSAWDSKIFRFRQDFELYYGRHNITLRRDSKIANGKFDEYGLNINIYYDLPSFSRMTPYAGISAMVLGMRLKFKNINSATALKSQAVQNYLGSDTSSTRGLNLLYGYGFVGGVRFEVTSWLALDAGYRFSRWSDCVNSGGCNLMKPINLHEVRANLVLWF